MKRRDSTDRARHATAPIGIASESVAGGAEIGPHDCVASQHGRWDSISPTIAAKAGFGNRNLVTTAGRLYGPSGAPDNR